MASSSGHAREEVGPSLLDAAVKVASGSRSEAPDTDQRFPRAIRLTSRRQFLEVYDRGRRARRAAFVVFGLANDLGHCRLGLTVTKRAGSAVVRNRIKRRLREAFRRQFDALPGSMDLVVNARSSVLDLTAERLERDLVGAVRELVGPRREG